MRSIFEEFHFHGRRMQTTGGPLQRCLPQRIFFDSSEIFTENSSSVATASRTRMVASFHKEDGRREWVRETEKFETRVRFLSRIESSTREKYTGETMYPYDFPLLFSLPFFFFTCVIYFRKIFSALYSFQQVVGNTFIRNKRHVFFYSHNSIYNSSSKI